MSPSSHGVACAWGQSREARYTSGPIAFHAKLGITHIRPTVATKIWVLYPRASALTLEARERV